ncbi:MAG: cytochrome c-type biogenesis protein CcmH [Gaiellaceae bacterium]
MRRLLLVGFVALIVAAPASASERHPTLNELEGQVMCPTCHTTLDQSDSAVANRIRVFIRRRIAAGDTRSAIEQELVDQFGPAILAAPPRKGFGLLAWWLPLGGILVAAAAIGAGVWRWSRRESTDFQPPGRLDPELERRVDEALVRFDG